MSTDDQDGDDNESKRLLSGFEKLPDFRIRLQNLLALDCTKEGTPQEQQEERYKMLMRLEHILGEYQEQAYLLDPHLEELVKPVADALRNYASWAITLPEGSDDIPMTRATNLAFLLHSYVATRGYKSIIRFFPHTVSDLPIALSFMTRVLSKVDQVTGYWALRYSTLLWLALVCMLPFDLRQFDASPETGRLLGGEVKSTTELIQNVAQEQLGKAGVEREGAAFVLSRLYMRKDTHYLLDSFVEWIKSSVKGVSHMFLCIGCLQALAEFVKSTPLEVLQMHSPSIRDVLEFVSGFPDLMQNTIVRKYNVKLISRLAIRALPAKRQNSSESVDEMDIPEEVEIAIQELFETLQDKDTLVRWSSAKGIARIAERLPQSFADQILDNVLSFFTNHGSIDDDGVMQGLPPSAEQPWHGATLACAELVRRGLVRSDRLQELLQWMAQALYFDVRRGANSVGISVRDAAAYVLWSLARVPDTGSLKPHAVALAQKLANVALFDREISIRRAASAAFQEHVGRMGLFPHGIDILGKMDFFAVSNRRNSFTAAAPQVAMHPEYRSTVIKHLFSTTLRHWDEVMRRLGSSCLRKIAETDLIKLLPDLVAECKPLVHSMELIDVHGALLTLSELSVAISSSTFRDELEPYRQQIFRYILEVPQSMLFVSRNHLVLEATCVLIASSLSKADLNPLTDNRTGNSWRAILDKGLTHRESRVQEAAALATLRLSELEDCSALVDRYILSNRRGTPSAQRGLAIMLGFLDFTKWSHNLKKVLACLLTAVDLSSSNAFSDIEARKLAYDSLARMVKNVSSKLPDYLSVGEMNSIFDAFFAGMRDYTVNERGDVGSWVRLSCIRGLCSIIQDLIQRSHSSPFLEFPEYLPAAKYHRCVAEILKQGVERLDNVRQHAGEAFSTFISSEPPDTEHGERWQVKDRELHRTTFCTVQHSDPNLPEILAEKFPVRDTDNSVHWGDGAWLFPKAVQFLNYEEYRGPVLKGLIASISSKTGYTGRTASTAFVDYANSLPVSRSSNSPYDLLSLAVDVLSDAKKSPSSNIVVVPILQTFNVLLEAEALSRLNDGASGTVLIKELMNLASRNVEKLKSPQRVLESMKIIIYFIASNTLRAEAVPHLSRFLLHAFPKASASQFVRGDTAEALYLSLQTKDIEYDDEVDEILLETDW
ncbi:TBCD protein [Schizopora paradoxa]|uniref:TBCD protein n=1 Tax=Schizopora paradoxa TaxID=27342 RepID=A0A0H2RI13_9AGAM|nr:TBCD protein [Schizopora paradoxa]